MGSCKIDVRCLSYRLSCQPKDSRQHRKARSLWPCLMGSPASGTSLRQLWSQRWAQAIVDPPLKAPLQR